MAAASSPLAPPNCSSSMLPKRGSGSPTLDGVHQLLDVVVHCFAPRSALGRASGEERRAGGRFRQTSAAARFASASSALPIPPCAADQATGFSRNRRTSASAGSEKYGRSRQASSTSHQVHR